jgi:hypothetical protein
VGITFCDERRFTSNYLGGYRLCVRLADSV